jgi:hypothetical protein
MDQQELNCILEQHKLWLAGSGGLRADLSNADLGHANLSDADLRSANLSYADLSNANLSHADLSNANLSHADLSYANLSYANLRNAYLSYANLRNAYLSDAYLRSANLICLGNMKEIKTLQIDTWHIGYTHDTLQIGCQKHSIDKWRKWDTEAGKKWIDLMDDKALAWAERNLDLVLRIIDTNPATK